MIIENYIPKTQLEHDVIKILNNNDVDNLEKYLNDVLTHGCVIRNYSKRIVSDFLKHPVKTIKTLSNFLKGQKLFEE